MGARLPPHGAAVRGRTQNFLPGSWLKILWPVHLTLDRWNGRGLRLPPGKSTAGKQAAGGAAGGRTAAPSGAVSSHTVRCAGSAGHGATGAAGPATERGRPGFKARARAGGPKPPPRGGGGRGGGPRRGPGVGGLTPVCRQAAGSRSGRNKRQPETVTVSRNITPVPCIQPYTTF